MKPCRFQRGATLVEALAAFALSLLGLVAVLTTQAELRRHSELSRQRNEAAQLGQQLLQRLRGASDLTAPPAPAQTLESVPRYDTSVAIVPRGATLVEALATVQWTDRDGTEHTLRLPTQIARLPAELSGRLALPPAPDTVHRPHGRARGVPLAARDLGSGRSAWRPSPETSAAWVFDNASGRITQLCSVADASGEAPTEAQLAHCVDIHAWHLSGEVHFEEGVALPLQMQLALTRGDADRSSCVQRRRSTRVRFDCLVAVDPHSGSWSGRLDVRPQGWAFGHGPSDHRLCRYTGDWDGNGQIDNREHPLDYRDVKEALAHQNFLVLPGPRACPGPPDDPHAPGSRPGTREHAPHAQG